MSDHISPDAPHAIAVVGMSGRFPGAADIDALWESLVQGVELVGRFDASDLRQEGLSPELLDQPDYVPAGGALTGIELFDAGFFGFNPREAEVLDPQHRVFLECAWEALERAGHPPSRFNGAIGVYAGAGASTNLHRLLGSAEAVRLLGTLQITIGNEKDHLTTRAAYKLGLRGPAVTVQTTCSSSLVAIGLACQSLMARQCDLALAGGVSVVMPQRAGYRYKSGGILSPDGHCRAFDVDAAGAVGGNGAGVVALRRLTDALQDGDHVHAVLRGSAINNDGAAKVGYTAPSIDGQADVIRRALRSAGLAPVAIGYVEAHGTGTPLGDPIEVAALAEAFGGGHPGAEKTCWIGSLKTNIGHLDAAAGVAGLIKAVLCLEREMLPPSLHFRAPNPELRLGETPFSVVVAPTPWPRGGLPRRAGVSSFGIGGTNAHVIVEEAPPRPPSIECPCALLVLSARSAAAADRAAAALADHLERLPSLGLADVAFTLQSGRHAFAHRRAVVASSPAEAAGALRSQDRRLAAGLAPGQPPSVAFLFPGQGTQRPGMGGGLYRTEPVYRAELDICCELLADLLGHDLRELLVSAPEGQQNAARALQQTELAQPALFVTELALARLLESLGVRPAAMLGHSVGELTAACLAGVMTREDALTLVAERGRLMGNMVPGAMLAVPVPEHVLRGLLPEGIEIAAINAPLLCTVSGPETAIAHFAGTLSARGVVARRLSVSHGFHSAAMESAALGFARAAAQVALGPPQVPYLSNLTGDWASAEQASDPEAWGLHIRAPVRFSDCVRALLGTDCVLLEVGPGAVLGSIVRQCAPPGERPVVVACLPGAGESEPEDRRLAETVGRLWVAGVDIDWAAYAGDRPLRRVPLPTYPFERSRYWLDVPRRPSGAPSAAAVAKPAAAAHGERRPADEWLSVPSWRRAAPAVRAVADEPHRIVLLADDGGIAARLAQLLNARGCHTSVVPASLAADSIGGGVDLDVDAVVHLRALDEDSSGDPISRVRQAQARGFDSVLALLRGFTGAHRHGPRRIVLLTDRAVDVTGSEQLRPEQAMLHGLARVVAQEHPGLACGTVDVVAADLRGDAEALELLAEELCGGRSEPSVALRGRHRWLPGFELLGSPAAQASRLRRGGTYLITGGLGRIGLTLAEDLARRVQARLVLVARTELPERSRWAGIGESDPHAVTVRRLLAIERAGGAVLPLAADVADRGAMADVLARAERRFGALDGVVHAAGAVTPAAFAPLERLGADVIRDHFGPKIEGTLVLDELLGDRLLPVAMFTSSLSAVLGGAGFGAYAAANAFLDAFAAGPGRGRWMSVGWEGWSFARTADPQGLAKLALSSEEGTEVFHRLTAVPPVPRVAVSTGDLTARIASWVRLDGSGDRAPTPRSTPAHHARPQLSTNYVPPANALEHTVADVWQELLGIAPIGRHDDFFALGGHSLLAIQIISRLRDTFGVGLSLHGLFDRPTVAELAANIGQGQAVGTDDSRRLAELLDVVEGLSEEEVEELLAAEDGGRGE